MTLDQVRKAGRVAAWSGTENGRHIRVELVPPSNLRASWRIDAGEVVPLGAFSIHLPTDGWRHNPGCDCEVCCG